MLAQAALKANHAPAFDAAITLCVPISTIYPMQVLP
jgi:hypothetical protein